MKAKTWAAGLGTAAIAAALTAGIPVPASAQPVPGPEEFTVIVAGNAPQLFSARGTLDAAGTAVPVSGGTNGGVDKVQLPGGTFTLTLQNTSGGGTPVNPVTCIATFHGAGISTISDGTSRFAGTAGSGAFTFHGAFFATRTPRGCSQQGTAIDIVHDHGTLTLGEPGGRIVRALPLPRRYGA